MFDSLFNKILYELKSENSKIFENSHACQLLENEKLLDTVVFKKYNRKNFYPFTINYVI